MAGGPPRPHLREKRTCLFQLHVWNGNLAGGEYDDILEYDPEGDSMVTVGHMTRARSQHAISVVQAGDYLQWCQ